MLLSARKLIQSKLQDVENSLRGILRGFALKVGRTTKRSFPGRVRELVAGHASLEVVSEALLSVHAVLLQEFKAFEKRVREVARQDDKARLLMTVPAVGPIVALTYASAIDDPARFTSSKAAGAHFVLTPRKYQSGETYVSCRISKIADAAVRSFLYEAAPARASVRGTGERLSPVARKERSGLRVWSPDFAHAPSGLRASTPTTSQSACPGRSAARSGALQTRDLRAG